MASLTVALCSNASITDIDLSYNFNNSGYQAAQQLATIINHNSTLRVINFSKNSIGSIGTQHICNALSKNSTLKKINLSQNNIDNTGLNHIANVINDNSSLISIDLSDNKIDKRGVSLLLEAINNNDSLTEINLKRSDDRHGNYLDQKDLTAIEKKLNANKHRAHVRQTAKTLCLTLFAKETRPILPSGLIKNLTKKITADAYSMTPTEVVELISPKK